MPATDRIDLEAARDERDAAYAALAEIEALPLEDRHQSATILRRFRLNLSIVRQRQYDRLLMAARAARRFDDIPRKEEAVLPQ